MAEALAARASSLARLRETYGSPACIGGPDVDADEDAWLRLAVEEASSADPNSDLDKDDRLESEWDDVAARTDILRREQEANFGKIRPSAVAASSTALTSYKEVQAWISSQVGTSMDVLQPLENRTPMDIAAPTVLQKRQQRRGGKDLVCLFKASPFDFNIPIHFKMLQTVYSKLTHNKWCPSVGSHWEVIGFQGGDPRTDLNRSGGVLNVLHLFSFVTQHPDLATACFQLSQDEWQNFPLACISINISSMVIECFVAGRLSALCSKEHSDLGVLEMTCRLQSACLSYFCSQWRSQKRTIVHTEQTRNEVRAMLEKKPRKLLEDLAEATDNGRFKKSTGKLSLPEFADLESISGVAQAPPLRRGLWARSKAAVLPKRLRRYRDENVVS